MTLRPWLLRVSVVSSALTLILVVVVTVRSFRSEWDPLGPYPEQTVQPSAGHVDWAGETYSESEVSIPAVRLGDPVVVTGTKCAAEPVTMSGTKAWTSRDPAGYTYADGQSVVPRLDGCRTATYENRVPDDVAAWVADELRRHPFVVMVVGGCETPVENERSGKVECWRSEPFAFVGR